MFISVPVPDNTNRPGLNLRLKYLSSSKYGHFRGFVNSKGWSLWGITGNVHIDYQYRPWDSTCGVHCTVTGYASCHSLSPENATHLALAGTGVQVDARLDSHTDFHLQQKIEYKSGFNGNDYKRVVYLG